MEKPFYQLIEIKILEKLEHWKLYQLIEIKRFDKWKDWKLYIMVEWDLGRRLKAFLAAVRLSVIVFLPALRRRNILSPTQPASQSVRYSFIRSRSSINMQQQVAFSSFFCMEADSLHFVNFLKLIEIDYICPAKTKIIEAAKF